MSANQQPIGSRPVRNVPCTIGRLEFPPGFNRPEVSSNVTPATAKVEPIDTDPITQKLGPGVLSYSFTGHVFTRGANYLTSLRRSDEIEIQHRRVGTIHAVVTGVNCTSSNAKYYPNGNMDYRHDFDLSVVVAEEINPPPGAYLG